MDRFLECMSKNFSQQTKLTQRRNKNQKVFWFGNVTIRSVTASASLAWPSRLASNTIGASFWKVMTQAFYRRLQLNWWLHFKFQKLWWTLYLRGQIKIFLPKARKIEICLGFWILALLPVYAWMRSSQLAKNWMLQLMIWSCVRLLPP